MVQSENSEIFDDINQALNNQISINDLLGFDGLEKVAFVFNDPKIHVEYNGNTMMQRSGNIALVEKTKQKLNEVLIALKDSWAKLTAKEFKLEDLNKFAEQYKISEIEFNLKDKEVRIESGKYHLILQLDF